MLFDFFRGSDGYGRLTLARIPKTFVRLCVELNQSGDVSFHWLVFAERKGEDKEDEEVDEVLLELQKKTEEP